MTHHLMRQRKHLRKAKTSGIKLAMQRAIILYWMAVSFVNMNHALVAVGFGFTTFTGTPSTHQWSKLHMSNTDNTEEEESSSNKENEGRANYKKRLSRKASFRMKKSTSSSSTLLPPPSIRRGVGNRRQSWANVDSQRGGRLKSLHNNSRNRDRKDSDNVNEQTARRASRLPKSTKPNQKNELSLGPRDKPNNKAESTSSSSSTAVSKSQKSLPPPSSKIPGQQKSTELPEWGVLFSSPQSSTDDTNFPSTDFPTPAIEGVLPVSELFYRSTQSLSVSVEEDKDNESSATTNLEVKQKSKSRNTSRPIKNGYETGDDEELPFSAEQSDRLSTPGNKIQIRRNTANNGASSSLLLDEIATGIGIDGRVVSEAVRRELKSMARQEEEEQRRLDSRLKEQPVQPLVYNNSNINTKSSEEDKPPKSNKKRKPLKSHHTSGRKMVRRGMEMLVGGEPINADPPQRAIELNYFNKHPRLWNRAITLNSPDFGPFLHMHSAGKISRKEVGLYCEYFVGNAIKWNVCPEDLKGVVAEGELGRRNEEAVRRHVGAVGDEEEELSKELAFEVSDLEEGLVHDDSGRAVLINPRELEPPKGFGSTKRGIKKKRDSRGGASGIASDKPLRSFVDKGGDIKKDVGLEDIPEDSKLMFSLGGELKFSLGVSKAELESGHEHGKAFRRVLREGIGLSINADEMGFDVAIAKLVINDVEDGSSLVVVQFALEPREAMEMGEAERIAKHVNGALASAMDDGKMAMALAQVTAEEKGWSSKIRNRIVEEFLFETEDDDEDSKSFEDDDDDSEEEDIDIVDEQSTIEEQSTDDQDEYLYDGPFGMAGDPTYEKDDLWLGGGNGGVFFDYSESNYMNSPYKGTLGPYLIDAAAQRAKQNQPRVIAIGDVHGCIDELQALLRKCDYHPGDLVVFLGDLVCKGPDSLSVVQMAREIGAIGVRGNHDFEVVRWHQAIKSGADPPVIGSEHYYVASALSTADLKWMYSLPWFISSSPLNSLFVHAGFVSGIRLAKQNPRLMMNMRSILPDGTVTSKFFNNWPWARLWDGPQTVFFGHDADRGLQQYEHAIGLDTGCVYGGKLTACILPERKLVSVNAKREYFQYRRKHFD